jgi:phosphate transport system substrate-binding protein
MNGSPIDSRSGTTRAEGNNPNHNPHQNPRREHVNRTLRARLLVPAIVGGAARAVAAAGGAAGAATKAHDAHAKKHKQVKLTVPKPAGGTLSEAGSSLLYPLWKLWVPGYTAKYTSVTIQAAAGGSGAGITGATNGTLQIGASDAYLSTSEKQADPTLENIPLAISAQEIYYNLPTVTAHLKLTGKVLAEMYTGKVTKWNTSAIASLNPGVTLPTTPVVTLHRSDGSGDTFLFTTYLSDTTKSWATTVGYNTSVTWPKAPGELAENGNSGMVAGCKTTPGCVAYIGISYQTQALGDGLSYAQLKNGKGQYIMPTATTIQAEAAGFTSKTPKTGAISMIDGKIKGGYPIINYEYAIVSKKQSSSSVGKTVRSVLDWAINPKDGNSANYLSQVGFRPLPLKIAQNSFEEIQAIK